MTESAKRWMEWARYDLETARAMFDSGRHLYVLFCCQQPVEKMLKALIAERAHELPPRLHQLVRLAELAGVNISEDQAQLLRELSAYYLQARYPEELSGAATLANPDEARRVLNRSEEMLQWLNSMLS